MALSRRVRWPTPSANEDRNERMQRTENDGTNHHSLTLAKAILWPTVTAQDAKNTGGSSQRRRNTVPLNALAKWPTPAAGGSGGSVGLAGGSGNRQKLYDLLGEEEGKRMGCQNLNPAWVESLQGFSVGWTEKGRPVPKRSLRDHEWPAGLGEEQYAWEPPRVAPSGPDRNHRLKGLGNAVVPQVALEIGLLVQRILEGTGQPGDGFNYARIRTD